MRRAIAVLAVLLAALAAPSATAAAAPQKAAVAFGAYLPDLAEEPGQLDSFSRLVGRSPVVVGLYDQWDVLPFDPAELGPAWRSGAVPMVTWEPLSYSGEEFPLRAIQRGRFDQYIRESAAAARRWGKPLLVRFAHEMNGDWYPWGRGVEGNNSYRYRAVWRRVVEIFRNRAADNVQWVWTPNVNTGGELPFQDLYPGDRWVDWVGFDGFNWAERGEWNSFTELVDNTYEELATLTDKPMIVAETGSSQSGGDKAAWISSALRREIPAMPRIRALVWFNERFEDSDGEGDDSLDPRVNSSPAALRAFRRGIASPYYGLTRAQLLATPARFARGPVSAPDAPSEDFGQPSLLYRYTHKLHGPYLVAAIGAAVAALLLLGLVAGLLVRRARRRRQAVPEAG
jgi:Glycosyl hydrolase family 26